jgi:hypothetical protein
MLDDIKPGNQIERFAFIRQSLRGPLPNVIQSTCAAKIERFAGNVHAFRSSKTGERLEVAASATANVQNAGLGISFRAQLGTNASHKVGDDAPPADVPPVLVSTSRMIA